MQHLSSAKALELADRLYDLCNADSTLTDRMLKIRQIMEQLYKAVTEDARISFNGLFARMQYVQEAVNMDSGLMMQSNRLRILCNQIAHDEIADVSSITFSSSVLVIYLSLKFFSQNYEHPGLKEYLESQGAVLFAPLKDTVKLSFLCMIQSWQVLTNPGGQCSVELIVVKEDGIKCNILLHDDSRATGNDGRIYSKLTKSLWKYASLQCHNLSEVTGKAGFYQSNPGTLVVLEPDFLIDASALAECFSASSGNPENYMLNRLFSEPSTEAMLQGMVVNGIFDELIFEGNADYLELFKRSIANYPIAMVALGKEAVLRIYNTVSEVHLPQIKSYIASLGEAELLLEPSFICPEYGLQGRLDLLTKKAGKYSIVELKSGKPHPTEVWTAHQMQVIAYNMIIRNSYGTSRISNASILYSASKDNPVRHVVNISILEQNLLMCRNRIIGIMHLLTEKPDTFFSWLITMSDLPGSPFIRQKLERFRNLHQSWQDYEYEWFLAQVQRIVQEIWFVKTGDNSSRSSSFYGHNALWQQSKNDKLESYKIITDLQTLTYDRRMISFAITPSEDIADFREGDIVVLYSQEDKISKQEILRGIIALITETKLQIKIRGGLKNNHRFAPNSLWAIEHDTLETSLYAPLSSVIQFLGSDQSLRRRIIGKDIPVSASTCMGENEPDLKQIINRMHAANELFIVQGPPGTGKTSGLLSVYVQEIYQQSPKKVLILSFTNRAVDEICLSLMRQNIPFIRTGNSGVVQSQLLGELIAGKRFEEMDAIIRQNRIWIATVQSANAWYKDFLRILALDELIIDEASQIIENNILGIVSHAPKTILIGDQNQLPPICMQNSLPYKWINPDLPALGYGSYHQSLMERLSLVHSQNANKSCLAMLRLHYRMHSDIAALISHFYDNKLQAVLPAQSAKLLPNPLLPEFLNQRLVWISCLPSRISNYDPLQVELIGAIVQSYVSAREVSNPQIEIGIVVPFRAMIHALRKTMPECGQKIVIDTVERFQGSERDIIILSLPLRHASSLHQVESLSDDGSVDRKLNVALSRARQRIIIVGNLELCQASVHYAKLISELRAGGNIVDIQQALNELTKN